MQRLIAFLQIRPCIAIVFHLELAITRILFVQIRSVINELPIALPMSLMFPKTLPQIGGETEIQLLASGPLQNVEVIHNVDSEGAGLMSYHNLSALVTSHTLYVVLTTWQSAVFLLNSRLTHFTATQLLQKLAQFHRTRSRHMLSIFQ